MFTGEITRTSIDHIFSSCRGADRLRRQLFPNYFNVAEDERLQYILSDRVYDHLAGAL
jgi:hypothetical protein